MNLIFPCHPLKPRLPDLDYETEVTAARDVGFECLFYNLDLLRDGDASGAFALVTPASSSGTPILHRGWMMSEEFYSQLYSELVNKGYTPVVPPAQYAEAHYLPNAYTHIAGLTPESDWINGANPEEAWALYQRFRHEPSLVKDFVKSAKHLWNEACLIPAHTSRERFEEIMRAFLNARGHQFNKGLVLRRFHNLVTLQHDIRGQPVHEEYRLFFWQGALLAATPPVHENGPFDLIEKWTNVARRFQSPFISMDIARQEDGSWIIIEVGDGGVSGLPPSIENASFYSELFERRTV